MCALCEHYTLKCWTMCTRLTTYTPLYIPHRQHCMRGSGWQRGFFVFLTLRAPADPCLGLASSSLRVYSPQATLSQRPNPPTFLYLAKREGSRKERMHTGESRKARRFRLSLKTLDAPPHRKDQRVGREGGMVLANIQKGGWQSKQTYDMKTGSILFHLYSLPLLLHIIIFSNRKQGVHTVLPVGCRNEGGSSKGQGRRRRRRAPQPHGHVRGEEARQRARTQAAALSCL